MTVPIQAIAAESVPEIAPNNAVVATVIVPNALLTCPTIELTKLISLVASPLASITLPSKMKRGTASITTDLILMKTVGTK
ncbi:unnamed protein product [marine sediment metagenome]|uniref:Uncharacterized protein n=1 Tax=marine sediment metagenome TaxID=412755 RepID=X1P0R1_9ZZZZ